MSAFPSPTALALVAAVASIAAGVHWNTFAAGGSDSHCYLQQARLFARGDASLREPLALDAPWPAVDLTFAPAGFVPSDIDAGASVPICPPGLSVVMAPLAALGPVGERFAFLVVPALGGYAVWLTFLLGRRMAGPAVGLGAACLLACSPIFLYQIVQPMSDVPATTWWLAAVTAAVHGSVRGRAAGGLAAGMALLTRPNLAPLAIVLGGGVVVRPWLAHGAGAAVRAALPFAGGLIPPVCILLALQAATHGSPFRTGYGDPSALFSAAHVYPNLQRYVGWLWQSHGPVLALAAAGPFVIRRLGHRIAQRHDGEGASRARPTGESRDDAWLLLAMSATTLACYLPYIEFDDWWYIRFLLPALPLLIVLSVVIVVWLTQRLPSSVRTVSAVLVMVGVAGSWVSSPHARLARRLQHLERHFIDAGHMATRLPENAVVLTVTHSGSVRFHGGRPTLLWESLDPAWFDRVLDHLRQRGRHPYLMLASTEMDAFKSRFRGRTVVAELDWPPVLQLGRAIRIYDPVDRARFVAGARVLTEPLWSPVAPASPGRR